MDQVVQTTERRWCRVELVDDRGGTDDPAASASDDVGNGGQLAAGLHPWVDIAAPAS
ncbi:hypothetical protein BH23ACT10_BH23ACT10_11580 [soil metagenome]